MHALEEADPMLWSFLACDATENWAAIGCCNGGEEAGGCTQTLPFFAFFAALSSSCSEGTQGIPLLGGKSLMLDRTSNSELLSKVK